MIEDLEAPSQELQEAARQLGRIKVTLDFDVYDGPNGTGNLVSHFHKEDITVLQLAQMIQSGFMALTGQTIKETGGTTQSITGAMTANTPKIHFGIGTTAAAFTDFAIQTTAGASSDQIAATVNAISSNTFTVTATWNNTTAGTIAITELGLEVTSLTGVAANKTYLLTHDVFAAQNVSSGGSAAATLTFTFT